jgi:hypothetical protein
MNPSSSAARGRARVLALVLALGAAAGLALAGCKSTGAERAEARFGADPVSAFQAVKDARLAAREFHARRAAEDDARAEAPESDVPEAELAEAEIRESEVGDSAALGSGAGAPAAGDPSDKPAGAVQSARRAPVDPARLMGLGKAAVNARLGPPSLVRVEAPSEIWQYRAQGCVFDLVFYPADPDGAGAAFQVLHLEARTRTDAAPLDLSACLARLRPAAAS